LGIDTIYAKATDVKLKTPESEIKSHNFLCEVKRAGGVSIERIVKN
jgi:hypothetical protein